MPQTDADVLVIGAGVIGLTTAICLAEAGVRVTVAAAEAPRQTTSVAAGALWGPHLVGRDYRIARWAAVTRDRLAELAAPPIGTNALAGVVRTARGLAATAGADADADAEAPEYTAGGSPVRCDPAEVPAGYAAAWRLSAPLIAMPGYLDYLAGRLGQAGGTTAFGVRFGTLGDAREFAPQVRVLVNCTGYGARDLTGDRDLIAVRGQAVVVRNPGLRDFFVGTGAAGWPLTYLFPHEDVVVLGGTEEPGRDSRAPDPATAERILAACTAIRPELRHAAVVDHRVGLRPVRPSVRLDAEQAPGGVTVVHSYGHGGAGVTLSWGCAEDTVGLVLTALA
ncbi:MAG TPA: FAD-dependent oxidoreductase [Streptosporangiaceae bacterium]|nr:FAD-dependent oxidoreductase [Streptosporangiaceae bacterium]